MSYEPCHQSYVILPPSASTGGRIRGTGGYLGGGSVKAKNLCADAFEYSNRRSDEVMVFHHH